MKVIGAILMLIAVAGAWHGPVDKEYLEDWAAWLFFVILGMIGFLMVTL
jgi:putative Mn2+ efflux pump MntP